MLFHCRKKSSAITLHTNSLPKSTRRQKKTSRATSTRFCSFRHLFSYRIVYLVRWTRPPYVQLILVVPRPTICIPGGFFWEKDVDFYRAVRVHRRCVEALSFETETSVRTSNLKLRNYYRWRNQRRFLRSSGSSDASARLFLFDCHVEGFRVYCYPTAINNVLPIWCGEKTLFA